MKAIVQDVYGTADVLALRDIARPVVRDGEVLVSVGSIAGYMAVEEGSSVVGVEVNASHHRAVSAGLVRGICRPLHLGKRSQSWQIEIRNGRDQLCCSARLSVAVMS